MALKPLYTLTDKDYEIFELAEKDPNYFTDYYLRSKTSGTYFRPEWRLDNPEYADDLKHFPEVLEGPLRRWQESYDALLAWWRYYKEPPKFEYDGDTVYVNISKHGLVFHRHHGFRFLAWQMRLWESEEAIRLVLGAYGSGKTAGALAIELIHLATLNGFRSIFLGQHYTQYTEALRTVTKITDGTLYDKKFIRGKNKKPYPEIIIGNDQVGEENVIQCFSAGGPDGTAGMLSTEVDTVVVDQAEQVDDYPSMLHEMGTRMRGNYQGRERLAFLTLLANQRYNDGMYDLMEQAEKGRKDILVLKPETSDNPAVTPPQLIKFIGYVGGDKEGVRVHMRAGDVTGGGKHFPKKLIDKIRYPMLDELMKERSASDPENNWIRTTDRAGIVEWVLAPEPGHKYLVMADAGTQNPPERDSAPIGVWDITGCPEGPALLWAFFWVDGNNSVDPWVQQYYEAVQRYNALYSNGYDATGTGKGYDRWMSIFQKIMAEPMNLGAGNKHLALNGTKILMERGKLKIPNIPSIIRQLDNYDLPDDHRRQDIVMMIILTGMWLERIFQIQEQKPAEELPVSIEDRWASDIFEDRYNALERW